MDKLVCSLCGWESPQKRFKFKEINEHFENAYQIWCPRNCCREQYDHSIPKGYILQYWYDYGGWQTLEKKSKIIDIDFAKSVKKAKMIRDIGVQMLKERGNIDSIDKE